MKKFLPVLFLFFLELPQAFGTNCIESASCPPANPLDVLNLYDVFYGSGMSLLAMAMIIGTITIGVYVRNRSLPMLTILGLYEVAAFGSIITSKYFASQYAILEWVSIFGGVTALIMLILRLVKE